MLNHDEISLTDSQRGALHELGSRGAGGNFDQKPLGKLFAMGLVEVNENRRLVLLNHYERVAA